MTMKLLQKTSVTAKTLLLCLIMAVTPAAYAADTPAGDAIPQEKIDINSADATTIAQAMDGVGVTKAREIVAYRETHGKFQSLEQLLEVNGIGMATLEKNRHRILISSE